ncbi:Sua5/YciO/YrdC/YwlC family protein [Phycicoccus jejuensis]|uniref:Sua5/YciO/YrdC/YwlC family protein n=1 Tax=Phycicoccus jejuensis TaxID=367299 RepID=UPI0004C44845|nr:Sua5/YciO/YrdC/YwlC family protein [Phycicoccus jejuensis]
MQRNLTIFKLKSRGDMLPPGDVHQVRRTLREGGLCIVPSDTCYALAGKPTRDGVPALINAILDRHEEKISLSFASQLMIERYVDLSFREHRILDAADKDTPLTLVAPISQQLSPHVQDALPSALYTRGELGVRLPHSWIERQLSAEMDEPITSTAIYYDDGSRVVSIDDAIAIVVAGLMRLQREETPLIAIQHPTIKATDVSTVAGFSRDDEGRKALIVFREGAVERKRVIDIAGRISSRDVEEWT